MKMVRMIEDAGIAGSPTIEAAIRSATACTGDRVAVHKLARHAFGTDAAGLISRSQEQPDKKDVARFENLVARLARGEPVHRILGVREFHGLPIALDPAVLEPRDDSECLVEAVLERIEDRSAKLSFIDLGTGPGTIALALLSELPRANAELTDISGDALDVARKNAASLGYSGRTSFEEGSWFEPVTGRFDFIVSNPPYIRSGEIGSLSPMVRDHDPHLALDGGEDGLAAYRIILEQAPNHLKRDGFVAVEIGHDQCEAVSLLAKQQRWQVVSSVRDLAGHPRCLIFQQ